MKNLGDVGIEQRYYAENERNGLLAVIAECVRREQQFQCSFDLMGNAVLAFPSIETWSQPPQVVA